uniref:Uncharacterized protein n=1 Tax=Zea mays TaxID=4577 RepID=A0A804PDS0_MAIZE
MSQIWVFEYCSLIWNPGITHDACVVSFVGTTTTSCTKTTGNSEFGEDLLVIAADQPFRFPATFTFVVRAFSGFNGRV